MARRDTDWFETVRESVEASHKSAVEKIPLFFELLDRQFAHEGLQSPPAIAALADMTYPAHKIPRSIRDVSAQIRDYLARCAAEAGLEDPSGLAEQLFLLVPGAIVVARTQRTEQAANAARAVAECLIAAARRD